MLSSQMIGLLGVSIWETIYMVIISTVLAYACLLYTSPSPRD